MTINITAITVQKDEKKTEFKTQSATPIEYKVPKNLCYGDSEKNCKRTHNLKFSGKIQIKCNGQTNDKCKKK